MKKSSVVGAVVSILLCGGLGAASASAADPALDIVFFGNSFTISNAPGMQSVPQLVQSIATAAGQTRPNVENAAISSYSLSDHLAYPANLNRINSPTNFTAATGFQWDYVVIQELSTKPTNITGQTTTLNNGNPTAFKNDAQALYNTVKAHSPAVTPVLFETWARSPENTTTLPLFYPSLTQGQSAPYFAAANQMQGELKQYYTEARDQIGNSIARLAPVGDAFQLGGYIGFYGGDYYHENNRGAVLAALVLYETIYHADSQNIPYATMSQQLVLSDYAVNNQAQWATYTALAHAAVVAVPEPTSMTVMLGLCSLGILRLRRRNVCS